VPVSDARTYTVEAVDLSIASDDLLREVNDLSNEMTGESIPEDPPRPVAVLARRVRNRPKMFRTRDWLARASDGRLVGRGFLARVDADAPPELMSNVILAYDTMNTAPRGDTAMDDWHTTPEQIHEWDRTRRATGRQRLIALAIHQASGETAGYTELNYDPEIPHIIWQQGTAVVPAHRSQGIGKWIKAAILERAIRDWPAARLVRTGNADSNAPLLAINARLGFKPAWSVAIWEIGIGDARRYSRRS